MYSTDVVSYISAFIVLLKFIVLNTYSGRRKYLNALAALTIFGHDKCSTRDITMNKFESKYLLLDVRVPMRQRTSRNIENIAAVRASTQNEPKQSVRFTGFEYLSNIYTLTRSN